METNELVTAEVGRWWRCNWPPGEASSAYLRVTNRRELFHLNFQIFNFIFSSFAFAFAFVLAAVVVVVVGHFLWRDFISPGRGGGLEMVPKHANRILVFNIAFIHEFHAFHRGLCIWTALFAYHWLLLIINRPSFHFFFCFVCQQNVSKILNCALLI